MTALSIQSVSSIATPQAIYSDHSYTYTQQTASYDHGFTFNEIAALKNINSTTINNYTSHYLTTKQRIGDLIQINIQSNKVTTLTTPLIFNTLAASTKERHLYIFEDTTNTPAVRPQGVIPLTGAITTNNLYFEIEFIDEQYARVKHNDGIKDYFLNVVSASASNLLFAQYSSDITSVSAETSDVFRYSLSLDGYLQLFKKDCVTSNIYALRISDNLDALQLTRVSELTGVSTALTTIQIYYNNLYLNPKSATSWISYDINNLNTLKANSAKSNYDIPTQYLFHTNYNEINDTVNLNYLTLNNIRSESGRIKRGTNMYTKSTYIPEGDFREYTTLNTGNNQELGDTKITLNYVFFDKDITVKPDSSITFTTPGSMYPFDKLNVNDTAFASNGAFGAVSPTLADKVYKEQKNTTVYNNGRYLCTWFYMDTPTTPGIWVDRYYYPELITKKRALSSSAAYNPSFLDYIDTSSTDYSITSKQGFVFDKVSDLMLEPDTKYVYQRTGPNDINSVVSSLVPLVTGFTNYYDIKNNIFDYYSTEIEYDKTKYNFYRVENTLYSDGQFTISFKAFIDPSVSYGYQLLGNKTESGLSVCNDKVITPFIYTFQDNILYIYNTDYVLIGQTVLDRPIKDIITGQPLKDFFVICNDGYVYKLTAAGNKIKLEILPVIIGYSNFLQEDTKITFLLDRDGNCIEVIKNNLAYTSVYATILPTYTLAVPTQSQLKYANSILRYNDVLYRVPGDKVRFERSDSTIVYYVVQNRHLVQHKLNENKAVVFLTARSFITDFNLDENNNVIVAYKQQINKYSPNRVFLGTQSIPTLDSTLSACKIIDVDIVKEYTSTGVNRFTTLLVEKENSELIFIKSTNNNLTISNTGLTGRFTPFSSTSQKRYTQTNFNYINTTNTTNSIKFDLTLTNYLSSEDTLNVTTEFNLDAIDPGEHTFTYRFDAMQGNITLFVDGSIYSNKNITPGKYKIRNVFKEGIWVGATGFTNGITLADYLLQPGYYFTDNLKLKNLFIFDRSLQDEEIQALNMYNTTINDISLSIPAGQRNNIEEIQRIFKFSPASSSKNIDVCIKNLKINNDLFKQNISNSILLQAKSLLPVGVTINNIKFIDYK